MARCFTLSSCHLALLLFSSCVSAADWIPMDTSKGLVQFPTSIHGVAGYSILDAATNLNAINEAFIRHNKLDIPRTGAKEHVRGLVSKTRLPVYKPVDVTMFGSEISVHSLKGTDLGDTQAQLSLGANFLSRFIVQLDYPNQRIRLLSRDSVDVKSKSNVPSKLAWMRDHSNLIGGRRLGVGLPVVKVRLEDQMNLWLNLDTAYAGGVLVERNVVERSNWLDVISSRPGKIQGRRKSADIDIFVLPTVKFGPYELGDVPVETPARGSDFEIFKREKSTGTHIEKVGSSASGSLGYEVLKHFVITLDYKSGSVHLGTRVSG